jgi:tetratricopeptide (TPR) repeat protein
MTPTLEQLLRGAVEHYRARQYRQAEAVCRQILQRKPDQPDALHMLGLLAGLARRPDDAIKLIGKAAALRPGDARFQNNLGNALCRLNRWEEGITAYRRALALQADQPDAHSNLAIALSEAGRADEAIQAANQAIALRPGDARAYYALAGALRHKGDLQGTINAYRQAVNANPQMAEAWNNLGVSLKDARQHAQAVDACRKAIELQPDFGEAYSNLSNVLCEIGETDQAIAAAQQAMKLRPDLPQAYTNLANALVDKGNVDEGIALCRRVIGFQPDFVDAYVDLGNALDKIGRHDEAVAAYQKAISLKPDTAAPYSNLAAALLRLNRLEEADAACRRALAIRPDFTAAKCNFGIVLQNQGRVEEAIAIYRAALQEESDSAIAHMNLGMALLLKGDYDEGWPQYEWRWHAKGAHAPPRKFKQPQWDGSNLTGQRLLIYTEQGFGDAIQFARFIPLAAERGANIIIECQSQLIRLFDGLPGVEKVVSRDLALPDFDVHYALMSLPLIFNTTLTTLPNAVPYLPVDRRSADQWRERLREKSARINVGLVWAGKAMPDPTRTIGLASLAPLAQIAGVRFVSLQKGLGSDEAQRPPSGMDLVDWTAELNDFADTAALMDALDLVITIDTASAHLAGALGKRAWTLLPHAAEWRWLRDREDSPWYPTMRLFRQVRTSDWTDPVGRIAQELQRFRPN